MEIYTKVSAVRRLVGATRKVGTLNIGMKPAREIQYRRKARYDYANKSEV